MADQPPPPKRSKKSHEVDEILNDNEELIDSDTLMTDRAAPEEVAVGPRDETEAERKDREAKEEQAVARKHDDGKFRVHAWEWELASVRTNYGLTMPRLSVFVEDLLSVDAAISRNETGDAIVPKKKLIQLSAREHEAFKALRAAAGQKNVSNGRPKKSEARGRLFDLHREAQDQAFLKRLADQEETYGKKEPRLLLDGARVSASGIVSLLNVKGEKKKAAPEKKKNRGKEKIAFSGLEYFFDTATSTGSVQYPGRGAAGNASRPSSTSSNIVLRTDRGRGNRGRGDQSRGDQSRGDQSRGDQSRGDQSRGTHGREDRGRGDRSRGDRSRRDRSRGNHGREDRGREDRSRGDRSRRNQGEGFHAAAAGPAVITPPQGDGFAPPEKAPEGTTAGDLYMRGYELGRAYGLTNETPGLPPRNEYLTTGSWDLFDLGWNHGGARGRLDAPPRAPASFMGGGGGGRGLVPHFGGGMGGPGRHMGPRDPGVWQVYNAADFEGSGEDEDEDEVEVEEPPRLSVRRGTYQEHEDRGQRSVADESSAFDQGLQQGRASVRGLGSQAAIPDPPSGISTRLRGEWTDGYRSGRESMQTLIEEEKRETIESHEESERTAARERELARVLAEQDISMEDFDAVESDNDSDDNAEDNDSQETKYKEIIPSDPPQAQVIQHPAPSLEVTTTTPQTTLNNTMSSVLSEAPTPAPIPVLDQALIDPVLRLAAPLLAPPNTANNNTARASSQTASQVSSAPITAPITAPTLLPVPPHSHMAPGFIATQAWIRGWNQGELAGRHNLSNRRPELQSASMGMSAEDRIAYIEGFGVGLADGTRRL